LGVNTVITWVRRLRQTGSVAPGKMGGHRPKAISGEHRIWLLHRIKDGDFTLRGLVAELGARGLKVDYRSVWEFIHAEKLSFKKKAWWLANAIVLMWRAGERGGSSIRITSILPAWCSSTRPGPRPTWRRCVASAPRGMRLVTKVPHGHWTTTTFLAALRHNRIEAPWLLEGPIDGESFAIYVEKVLLPTLRPGDIVIMDNLASHKGKIIRRLIRSLGAKLLFLPKYSPDLNPIEQVFAKLKHLPRKAAARTVQTVCAAIGKLLAAFTPEECANYFRNSGYAPT